MLISAIERIYYKAVDWVSVTDGLGPLALRLFLGSIMIQAGYIKFASFAGTVNYFGGGLGLPLPEVMAFLAASTEFVGGIFIVLGLATRLATVPLMVTMLVAIFLVHWKYGWLLLADPNDWFAHDRVMEATQNKLKIISILKEHGNYRELISSGTISMLNNGIERGVAYFVMLLALFFTGGGRYTSIDYWIARWVATRTGSSSNTTD